LSVIVDALCLFHSENELIGTEIVPCREFHESRHGKFYREGDRDFVKLTLGFRGSRSGARLRLAMEEFAKRNSQITSSEAESKLIEISDACW
jgi:hypothetical protein